MSRWILLASLFGLIVVHFSYGCQHKLTLAYDHIDKHIPRTILHQEAKYNMKLTAQWIKEMLSKEVDGDETLLEALKLLLRLAELTNDENCNENSLRILKENETAAGYKVRLSNSSKVRPIDQLVAFCIQQHVETCQNVYPKSLTQIKATMDRHLVKCVELIMKPIVMMHFFNQNRNLKAQHKAQVLFKKIIMQDNSLRSLSDAKSVYDSLTSLLEHYPSVDMSREEINNENERVEHLIDEYLVIPCKYYVEKLGVRVFIPAEYDASWRHNVKLDNLDYYLSWAYFKLCKSVLKDDQAYLLGKQILKILESERRGRKLL